MSSAAVDKQVLSTLKGCAVFAVMDDAELEKLAGSIIVKRYDAGTTIFKAEDGANELFVVQEGKVALQTVLKNESKQVSRRITVDTATRNEIVGWSAIVEPYVYTLTAVCVQNSTVLSINGVKLRQLLQDNHDIGFGVLKEVIKVVASRLEDTRQLLISERMLTPGSA